MALTAKEKRQLREMICPNESIRESLVLWANKTDEEVRAALVEWRKKRIDECNTLINEHAGQIALVQTEINNIDA